MKPEDFETLDKIQEIVDQEVKRRQQDKENIFRILAKLTEEVGELSKAITLVENGSVHQDTEKFEIPRELADIQYLIGRISNYYGILLCKALRDKMMSDEDRVYGVSQ